MKSARISMVGAAVLALVMGGTGSGAVTVASEANPGVPSVGIAPNRSSRIDPDLVLVRMRPSAPAPATRDRLARAGVQRAIPIPGTGWTALEAVGRAEEVRGRLRGAPDVLEVLPSYLRRASTIPDDPLWATRQQQAFSPLRMDRAWERGRGEGVIVAVIDSGIDFGHPDLVGRIVGPGLNLVSGGPAVDDSGHGTMVSGIVAANLGNRTGIAGVAPRARILPIKVLDVEGNGTDANIAIGIGWAVERGADVINLSLGGPEPSAVLGAAVANARSRGVVVVAAAGNSGAEGVEIPARLPGVLAVAATSDSGSTTSFSSFGWQVGVAAPGYRITSTTIGRPSGRDTYATGSGTSFSAPIVAGVAALVRARYPSLTAEGVLARIRLTARDRGPAGVDRAYGHGVVDPLAAVGGPPAAGRAVLRSESDADAGDLPGAAQVLVVGLDRSARIAPETDEDWYRVGLTPGAYRISVSAAATNAVQRMDPIIELYDPVLRRLATQEFGGGALEFRVVDAGVYAIRIRNRNASVAAYGVTVDPIADVPRFASPVRFGADSDVGSVAIADLTGDGRADAIGLAGDLADPPDRLLVVPQTARRTFGIPRESSLPTGVVGSSLAVGDVTGDGRVDLLLAAASGIVLLEQADAGRLVRRVIGRQGADRFAVADLDVDGLPDVVAGGAVGVSVLWGDADGSFAARTTLTTAPATAVAAVPGAVAAVHSGVVRYARATGRAFQATTIPLGSARSVTFVEPAGDLVVSRGLEPNGSIVVLRPSNALPPVLDLIRTISPVAPDPGPVVVLPLADGVPDVYSLSRATGDLGVVPLTGGPEENFPAGSAGGVSFGPAALAVGDLDGDAEPDVLVAAPTGMYMIRHGLTTLPAVYGRWLLSGAEPAPGVPRVSSGIRPLLAFTAPVMNAATAVRLVGRHGERVPAIVGGLGGGLVGLKPVRSLNRGVYAVRIDGLVGSTGDQVSGLGIPFFVGAPSEQVPPSVSITARPVGTVPPLPTVIRFAADDPAASFACSIDNAPYRRCRSPLTVWLGRGRHSLRLFARDLTGNESSAVGASWTVAGG